VMFQGAVDGGSAAAGLPVDGIAVGQRADFCVVDAASTALAGVPATHLLDALTFSSPGTAFTRVAVAGTRVQLPPDPAPFAAAMKALWEPAAA
jgi:formimidoylglutamate deiminase